PFTNRDEEWIIDRPAHHTGGSAGHLVPYHAQMRGPLPCPHPISTRSSAIRTRSRQRTATATLTRSGSTAPTVGAPEWWRGPRLAPSPSRTGHRTPAVPGWTP